MATIHKKATPNHCFWCSVRLTDYLHDGLPQLHTARTIDHVIPRSLGGRNVRANRVASCHACNQRKRDTLPEASVLKMLGLTLPEVAK